MLGVIDDFEFGFNCVVEFVMLAVCDIFVLVICDMSVSDVVDIVCGFDIVVIEYLWCLLGFWLEWVFELYM